MTLTTDELATIWQGLDSRITVINDRTKSHTISIQKLEKEIKEIRSKLDK